MQGIRRRMMSWDQRAMEARIQRAVDDGQLPADGDHLPPAPTLAPVLRRDADEPQHPTWFRIMALVQHTDGLHWHFVAEEQQLHRAIALCASYQFRAVVTNCHSRQEFNNWKLIETDAE